jgi:hypothetical protein
LGENQVTRIPTKITLSSLSIYHAQSSGMYMNADSHNKYSQYTKEKDSMDKDGDATCAHVAELDHSMMCRKLK